MAHLATKENIKIGEKRLWTRLRDLRLIRKDSTKQIQKALEQDLFEKSEFINKSVKTIEKWVIYGELKHCTNMIKTHGYLIQIILCRLVE